MILYLCLQVEDDAACREEATAFCADLAESNVAQDTDDAGTAEKHSCLLFGLTWGRVLVDCFDSVQDCFQYARLQQS